MFGVPFLLTEAHVSLPSFLSSSSPRPWGNRHPPCALANEPEVTILTAASNRTGRDTLSRTCRLNLEVLGILSIRDHPLRIEPADILSTRRDPTTLARAQEGCHTHTPSCLKHAHPQDEMSQHDALLVRTLQALQNVPPDGPELAAAIVQEELDFSQLQRLTLDDLREARAGPTRARRRGPPPPPSSLARGAAARGPLVESRRPLAFASHRVTPRHRASGRVQSVDAGEKEDSPPPRAVVCIAAPKRGLPRAHTAPIMLVP